MRIVEQEFRLTSQTVEMHGDVATDVLEAVGQCPHCGGALVSRDTHSRTLVTQGDLPVRLTRPNQTCPTCGTGLSPLDERLQLQPQRPFTPWLIERAVPLGASLPFAQAAAILARFTGVRMHPDQA